MSGGTAARLLLYPIKFRPSIVKLFGTGKPCDNAKTQQILPAVLDIVDRALEPIQRVFLSNRMGTGKTKTYLGAIHMYNEFRMDSFLDPPVANNQHVYHTTNEEEHSARPILLSASEQIAAVGMRQALEDEGQTGAFMAHMNFLFHSCYNNPRMRIDSRAD
ncbi:hypothetical protein BGZ61DRAFT_516940 [Ilyonectria robusta]|uniref:uncharacterized protein n=1 Tax=Ilyonectria robusta TaxID=1079257 RepID=UPI001E8CC30B|nr:uncharacterized protein BGZ61DRAFT_516940 [Ilyonectria robusta]KAH8706223.1 hypothetical protein BGZ61DRAFT_516940 [Ilyonectria robusta]